MASKTQILDALQDWVAQRPGLEYGNYGDPTSYRQEGRRITRQKHDAETLLRSCRWNDGVTADMLRDGFRAYSGRLSLVETADGCTLSYCTGQYWPTEYRAAACAVLASALWTYARVNMPAPSGKLTRKHGPFETEHDNVEGLSPGDWLRRYFRRAFGARFARRWFD